MSRPLRLLDLFCGAGGAAMGYYRAGFTEIVGVDIRPQKNYPFDFIQGDAMNPPVDLDYFDAIHASPPCQGYSITQSIHKWNYEYDKLIDQVRNSLIETGKTYIIENVQRAPMQGPIFCGSTLGLRVYRHRRFESNLLFLSPGCRGHKQTTGAWRGYSKDTPIICVAGNNFHREQGAKAMGIDWYMKREELAEAIPPAYTEFIGKQIINQLEASL